LWVVIGPSGCKSVAEAVRKPHSGRDKKHQEYEYDRVDPHSRPVVIVKPYVGLSISSRLYLDRLSAWIKGWGQPAQDSQVRRGPPAQQAAE